MPSSKSRAKRANPLKGIPGPILKRAPNDWSAAHQARWALAYMRGLAGREPNREDRSHVHRVGLSLAHQLGVREARADHENVALANGYFGSKARAEAGHFAMVASRVPSFNMFAIPSRPLDSGWGRPR